MLCSFLCLEEKKGRIKIFDFGFCIYIWISEGFWSNTIQISSMLSDQTLGQFLGPVFGQFISVSLTKSLQLVPDLGFILFWSSSRTIHF